jgi:hypothetical protein
MLKKFLKNYYISNNIIYYKIFLKKKFSFILMEEISNFRNQKLNHKISKLINCNITRNN